MQQVIPISGAEIAATDAPWEWAAENRGKISRHWKKLTGLNPALWNGPVHMLKDDYRVLDGQLTGNTLRGDFASLLCWREMGWPEAAGVCNGFGSAVLVSAEGHLLMGRMAPHTANAGLVYPFGGSLDDGDVKDGRIDLEGSIARELAEETGLAMARMKRDPGYLLVRDGARLSFCAVLRPDAPSALLRARIEAHLAAQERPEHDGIIIFRRAAFGAHHRMPGFARLILSHLLPEAS